MTSISKKYPWFKRYDELFFAKADAAASKIPQSMFWVGLPGLALTEFAREKAKSFLSDPADLLWVSLEPTRGVGSTSGSASSSIKIDQIRDLIDFMNSKTFSGVRRLVVIEEADRMNINAQNALLKTLEEPFPNAFIWLLTSHPKRLLPTIKSRCQLLSFFVEEAEAYQYFTENFPTQDPKILWEQCRFGPLNISEPLALKMMVEHLKNRVSPIFLAQHYAESKELGVNFILDSLYRWILDWHLFHLGGELVFFKGESSWFNQFPFSSNRSGKLKNLLKKIGQAKRAKADGINLNPELMLEDIFIDWLRV
jgi:hypothetical protein